jgi:hypothetical protein
LIDAMPWWWAPMMVGVNINATHLLDGEWLMIAVDLAFIAPFVYLTVRKGQRLS